ncbi:uncharacterized protein LOC110850857 isoform X2 [Folsomia candida]|uniref:Protein bric-a-brac 2 n=2 Tax=Folsomia candida TaxID=158441 RepID=A0A226E4S0_FOLCA|nr:uncharacterized protein LOC110850857 isoform X2 [Folsomia candida]OXA52583.1 Protein bric-a-brac 2 [Folsomia candida]
MGSGIQQYCLRWNNHRSNLLLVFEHLFQTEAFTDVTLACDGSSIKCHKMVLAACSSYFQQLFMENDCRHPIVILKDIKSREIKAILEYMYKGEVNVAQDQLAGLLKAAETLKVKGLVEDNHNVAGTATPTPPSQSPYQSHSHPPSSVSSNTEFHSTPNTTNTYSKSNNSVPTTPKYVPNDSPVYDAQYNASSYPDKNSIPFHLWPSTNKLPLLSSSSPKHAGSNNYDNSQNEPVPLKKKFMGPNKDTPILRTVLGHTALQQHNSIDSQSPSHYQQHQQPLSNQNTPPYKSPYMPVTTNGPTEHSNDKMSRQQESPDNYMDDSIRSVESDKVLEENSSFSIEDDAKSGIATYVPGQKPEWKRYKQYTRNDIMAAIEAVKGGMSALQAARKYGVPSRTLYDKVKKLGITTNRPYRKGSFPMSPYQGMNIKNEDAVNYMKHDDNSNNYSPEDLLPLDISSTGNGSTGNVGNGLEGDSDKMDSDAGCSVKQENSPPMDGDEKDDSNHIMINEDHHIMHIENGSEICSSSSPRDRDPSEPEELRSASE